VECRAFIPRTINTGFKAAQYISVPGTADLFSVVGNVGNACPLRRREQLKGFLMMIFDIPGQGRFEIEHLVADYNGTLALDGTLLPGVDTRLGALSAQLRIHVLTADTFGGAASQTGGLPVSLAIIPSENQDIHKKNYVEVLGSEKCVCIGNGRNDSLMLETAAVGIVVVQQEGAAVEALRSADIVAPDIVSVLDLLLNPLRLAATLRR